VEVYTTIKLQIVLVKLIPKDGDREGSRNVDSFRPCDMANGPREVY